MKLPESSSAVRSEARQCLEADLATGTLLTKNRTYARYQAVKPKAEAFTVPHLVLDTGTTTPDECVQCALRYLQNPT